MVRLCTFLLARTPRKPSVNKVTRDRYLVKDAASMYVYKPWNFKVFSDAEGLPRLHSKLSIRLALAGCTNRPFYHIVLARTMGSRDHEVEQLGTYDPMPNVFNEKLCSLNFERIQYHIANGAHASKPIRRLLGLSGYLPLDPTLFFFAEGLRRRRHIETLIKEKELAEAAENVEENKEEIMSEETSEDFFEKSSVDPETD